MQLLITTGLAVSDLLLGLFTRRKSSGHTSGLMDALPGESSKAVSTFVQEGCREIRSLGSRKVTTLALGWGVGAGHLPLPSRFKVSLLASYGLSAADLNGELTPAHTPLNCGSKYT